MARHCVEIGRMFRAARQLLFLTLWLLPPVCVRSHAAEPWRVLMLHSYGRDFAPFDAVASSFRTELTQRSERPVEFFEASLEQARFDGAEREEPLIAFLRAVYGERPPDLVVPCGAPAVLFCHRNRERLFRAAPVLGVGADQRRLAGLTKDANLVTVPFGLDLPGVARGIVQVLPETRHIHVVLGTAPVERFWEGEMRREWPAALPGVEFHWLSDQSLESIRELLSRTPPHSAVFHGILTRDAAGVPHEHESALAEVLEAANAPVFGYAREQFGTGAVGGALVSHARAGRTAAGVALRLLAGEAPGNIHVEPVVAEAPVWDWQALQRWRIPEDRLPPGSTVLFREAGLWETHRRAVLVTAGVLVLQTVLILLLLAARRRAREAAEGLRLAAEAARMGLYQGGTGVRDAIEASPEWRSLFGLPERGPVTASDVFERIHPDDRSAVRRSVTDALRHGLAYQVEHRVVLPDGEVRWVASRGRAEGGGQRSRTRGVSADITDRKRSEAEVAQQRSELAHLSRAAALGELSGALAHEINQPLGSIMSNAQAAVRILNRDEPDIGELRDILGDIVAEDRRAGEVIRRLRALLQRGETQPQPMDLDACADEVLELMRAELSARGVTVLRERGESVPAVLADRIQIQQVVLNFLTNACDAVAALPAERRVVTIRSARTADGASLAVEDRGAGLTGPPEALFAPFHTTKPDGLGIGLAICRSIAEAHGGRIEAEPGRDGGAVFRITLPAA